jgi:cyclohexa-1,5-dienecarbonyl-CoA hydratase
MSEGYSKIAVRLLEDERVLSLTLAGGKGNILDMAMMGELSQALHEHRDRQRLKLVLLSAAGKHFSFGASVEEHTQDQVARMLPAFHGLIRQVATYPVPVAALVQGRCLGGSFELVLACHFVFAAPDAIFGCPEIKLGVLPPVLAAIGAHRLGGATAERLLLTGADLPAADAARIGWAVVLDGEGELPDQLLRWYEAQLAPLSAYALRQATAAAREYGGLYDALGGLDRAERLYLDRIVPSHDGNEGITAFIERRKPEFTDQ